MSYFGETPSVENELKKLRKELNLIKVQAEFQPVTQVGHSTGEGVGGGTTSTLNDHLFKLQPVIHNMKRKVTDKDGNSKSGDFNKIFLTSSCVLVDKGLSTDTVGGGAHSPTNYQLELMTIQGAIGQDADSDTSKVTNKMHDGQIVYIKPRSKYDNTNGNRLGYSLTLKAKTSTEGNIDIAEDITINSDEFAILQWHEDAHATDGYGYFLLLKGGSGGTSSGSNTIKQPCRVATTGNNTAPALIGTQVDGVTIIAGDRVLYKNQTTQRDNGIYVCKSVAGILGTMERAEDFDQDAEVKSGVLVAVNEGTINGNTLWALTSDGSLTVGTSDLVFTKMTIDSSLDYTWSGKNLYINSTEWNSGWDTDSEKQANCQVKIQGDGLEHSGYSDNASQRVLEIGKYGTHEVKIIAEVTGEGDAVISDPDGAGSFTIPNSDPSISFKSSLVMNTYDIYDLDKMVFAQGASTTAPPMLNNWVGIQANTGEDTSGGSSPPNPVLNGMALHVPDNKKFFFKIGKGTTGEEAEGSNVHDAFKVSENGIEVGSSSVPSSLSNGMIWHNSSDNKVYVRSNGATSELGGSGSGVQLTDNPTWTGNHVWDTSSTWDGSTVPVKFQGDGANTSQTIMELGKHGNHSVKVIAELTGEGNAVITDPDGTGTYTIPNSDPSISMKASLVMNTYTMYDLDTLVFSQGASTTTPAPLADWVWIEANTGTGSSPVLTGMHYNVPSGKTHQFKVNGAEQVIIENGGISPPTSGGKNLGSPTLEWNTLYLSNGLYFGTGQENNTLYNVNGMHFNIGSTSDWYEFDIGTTNNTKLQIKDDKIIAHEHLLPITGEDYDLGSSSYEWHNIWGKTLQGVSYVDFESTGMKISNSSNDLDVRVATSQDINFKFLDGSTTTTEFKVSEQGMQLYQNSTPSSLQNGQIWYDGTDIKARTGGSTKSLSDIGGSSGGGAIQRYQLYNSTSSSSELEMWHCSSHSYGGNGDGMTNQTLTQYKIYWQPLMIPVACKLQYVGLWANSGNSYNSDRYDVGLYSNGGSGSDSGLLYPYQRLAQKTDVRSYNHSMWGAENAGDWNYSLDSGLYWLAVLGVDDGVEVANIAPKWMQPVGFYYESTSSGKSDSPVTSGATVGYYKTSQTSLPATAPDELDRRYSATSGWEPAIFCRFKS